MRTVEVKGLKFWVEQQRGEFLERDLRPTLDGTLRDSNIMGRGYVLQCMVHDKVIWDKMIKNGRKPHHSDVIMWIKLPENAREV